MHIKELAIDNFRNFAQVAAIEFPEQGMLVAAAPNATGKTNFLEALMVLLRGKSFRGSLEECVRWGEDAFLLRGEVAYRDGESRIGVRYHIPSRKLRIEENGVPASPVSFFSHYPVVVFLPEDTFMFNRGPAVRRSFLNNILISSPTYLSALVQYHRALKQRNTALKRAQDSDSIEAWTQLLVEHSVTIWKQRQGLTDFFTTHLADLYAALSGETREFAVTLTEPLEATTYHQLLQTSFTYEQRSGHTLYGPHRDDLLLTTNGRPLQAVLSRGQLRSVVIALKIAAHRYITQTTKEEPLLLLDEVLSELDADRQETLLANLPVTQTLLTCTAVPKTLQQRANVHLLDLRSILTNPASVEADLLIESTETTDIPIRTAVS